MIERTRPVAPGAVRVASGAIELNRGRPRTTLSIRNESPWPVGISSHMHVFEASRRLRFDRGLSYGTHLDVPSGSIVWIDPGEERTVVVVPFAGNHRVFGINGLVNGDLDFSREAAMSRSRERGFADGPPS